MAPAAEASPAGSDAEFVDLVSVATIAEVRAEADEQAALVSCLQSGQEVRARKGAPTLAGRRPPKWLEVVHPVPGWAFTADFQASSGGGLLEFADTLRPVRHADGEMLELMLQLRQGKHSPRHQCVKQTNLLIERLEELEEKSSLLTRLGHGAPSKASGSFLAELEDRDWWPPGYRSWVFHTFLLFEDGFIADLTADQWDLSAPQVWWPADSKRYLTRTREADEARAERIELGMDHWRRLDKADGKPGGVLKTHQHWLEVERKHDNRYFTPEETDAEKKKKNKRSAPKNVQEVPDRTDYTARELLKLMVPSDPDLDPIDGERMWVVVGGQGLGGVVVRRGESLASPQYPCRLSPGTKIEEVELSGNRLHYNRIRGDGPDTGWVSISYYGRPLAQLLTKEDEEVLPKKMNMMTVFRPRPNGLVDPNMCIVYPPMGPDG